jgi:hypothetical protein
MLLLKKKKYAAVKVRLGARWSRPEGVGFRFETLTRASRCCRFRRSAQPPGCGARTSLQGCAGQHVLPGVGVLGL